MPPMFLSFMAIKFYCGSMINIKCGCLPAGMSNSMKIQQKPPSVKLGKKLAYQFL